jgi:hypothetical protein
MAPNFKYPSKTGHYGIGVKNGLVAIVTQPAHTQYLRIESFNGC